MAPEFFSPSDSTPVPLGAELLGPGWVPCAGCWHRNPCLFLEHHEWLLGDEVDILPFLLLPLAGPEEFPEDEMESERGSEREVGWGRGAAGPTPP